MRKFAVTLCLFRNKQPPTFLWFEVRRPIQISPESPICALPAACKALHQHTAEGLLWNHSPACLHSLRVTSFLSPRACNMVMTALNPQHNCVQFCKPVLRGVIFVGVLPGRKYKRSLLSNCSKNAQVNQRHTGRRWCELSLRNPAAFCWVLHVSRWDWPCHRA